MPNERVFPMPGSNHRNICRFGEEEHQRFAPIALAMTEVVTEIFSNSELS